MLPSMTNAMTSRWPVGGNWHRASWQHTLRHLSMIYENYYYKHFNYSVIIHKQDYITQLLRPVLCIWPREQHKWRHLARYKWTYIILSLFTRSRQRFRKYDYYTHSHLHPKDGSSSSKTDFLRYQSFEIIHVESVVAVHVLMVFWRLNTRQPSCRLSCCHVACMLISDSRKCRSAIRAALRCNGVTHVGSLLTWALRRVTDFDFPSGFSVEW